MLRQDRVDNFALCYATALAEAVITRPAEYAYSLEMVPAIVRRMMRAVCEGTYEHDGDGLARACEIAGIDNSAAAVAAYLGGAR